MKRVRLGKTDLICSPLGLGTWGLGGRNDVSGVPIGWRIIPRGQARRTVLAALDAGVNFFDSSDFYGRGAAEELLGETISQSKEQVVIATKVGIQPRLAPGTTHLIHDFSPGHIEAALNASLRRLRRDYIDLYQLHGPVPQELADETWHKLDRLKEAGKIRYVGVSMKSSRLGADDFHFLTGHPLVSVVQVRYSLLHIGEATFIDNAQIGDCAVLARSIYWHGFLTGKHFTEQAFPADDHRKRKFNQKVAAKVQTFFREMSSSLPKEPGKQFEIPLQYAMSSPNISVAIVGATSERQIKENIAALEEPGLTDEMRQAIRRTAEQILDTTN